MEPDYQLKPPEGLGIKKASIRKIRVQHIGDRPHTIRIDLNRHCPDHVLYERLHAATRGLKLSMLQVTLVGIEATFDLYTDQKNSRPRMFEIAASNSCSLGNTPKDILLQRMLVENGIEPQLRAPADVDKQG